jgi:hypothetical protein
MGDSAPDYRPTASLARAWSGSWTLRPLAALAPASRALPRRCYEPALRPGKSSGTHAERAKRVSGAPTYHSTAGDPVESTIYRNTVTPSRATRNPGRVPVVRRQLMPVAAELQRIVPTVIAWP